MRKRHHKKDNLKRRYGITPEKLQEMKYSQNNKCKICEKQNELCVDHCHVNGKIRGLLCNNCNAALGMMKENIKIIKNAINYLKKNGQNINNNRNSS